MRSRGSHSDRRPFTAPAHGLVNLLHGRGRCKNAARWMIPVDRGIKRRALHSADPMCISRKRSSGLTTRDGRGSPARGSRPIRPGGPAGRLRRGPGSTWPPSGTRWRPPRPRPDPVGDRSTPEDAESLDITRSTASICADTSGPLPVPCGTQRGPSLGLNGDPARFPPPAPPFPVHHCDRPGRRAGPDRHRPPDRWRPGGRAGRLDVRRGRNRRRLIAWGPGRNRGLVTRPDQAVQGLRASPAPDQRPAGRGPPGRLRPVDRRRPQRHIRRQRRGHPLPGWRVHPGHPRGDDEQPGRGDHGHRGYPVRARRIHRVGEGSPSTSR
jgi:hypothetical protein